MSKRKISDAEIIHEFDSVESPAIEVSTRKSPVEITVGKYFQLYRASADKYMRVYAEERFRGIIKSKDSWDETINKFMEGER